MRRWIEWKVCILVGRKKRDAVEEISVIYRTESVMCFMSHGEIKYFWQEYRYWKFNSSFGIF